MKTLQNHDALKKNERLMEEASFGELFLKLCLPAVVVILIMIVYNMADTFFIGQTGNPDKISAISICMPVFTILSGLGTLFGIGGGTAISIALGEKNEDKIQHITAFCAVCAVGLGLVFGLLLFFFAHPIAGILGGEGETLDFAVTYLRVFSFACPFVLLSNSYGNILRSDGDATAPMLANIAGSLFNIVGDAILILVLGWDVFGAALATVLGNVLSVCLIFVILNTKKQIFIPRLQNLALCKEIIVPVCTLGLPMTCSTVLSSISGTVQNRLMMGHGSVFLAAQSVAGKLGMLTTMLIMGFCMGIQPAISYNFGSKHYKRMYQITRQITVFSVLVGLLMTGLIFALKDAAIALFIDNAQVIAHGQDFVLASVCVGPIFAVYQSRQTFLQATGKASYAIFVSFLDKGIIFLPVLLVMNQVFGAYGIAFSHAVTIVVSALVAVWLAKRWSGRIFIQACEDGV